MPATAVIESPTEDVADTFRQAEEHFGQVPNFVKVLANNPTFCKSITEFMIQAMSEGRVDWAFKELVILKTLRATGAYYGYGAHEKLAADLGNSPERIGDTHNSLWVTSDHFTSGEKAVFAYIEQIAEDPNDVGDEIWGPLVEHWDNGQLLELSAVVTTFINIGRMGDTLGVSDPVLFTKPVR
ncbi:MAG TPA: carboxymuconolactone decarboxylase family protein [Acidimicrobiia bacterium]|jgi:alkylhydroperoxidase family enzyme|nr:carboxymuconolactone decarboxylase family protein [Acidimicrobiia bacterium]